MEATSHYRSGAQAAQAYEHGTGGRYDASQALTLRLYPLRRVLGGLNSASRSLPRGGNSVGNTGREG